MLWDRQRTSILFLHIPAPDDRQAACRFGYKIRQHFAAVTQPLGRLRGYDDTARGAATSSCTMALMTIPGSAKQGAGMIKPDIATMLDLYRLNAKVARKNVLRDLLPRRRGIADAHHRRRYLSPNCCSITITLVALKSASQRGALFTR